MKTFKEFAALVEAGYLVPVEPPDAKWQRFLIEDLGIEVSLDTRDIGCHRGQGFQPYCGIRKRVLIPGQGIKEIHIITSDWENNPEARQNVGIFITNEIPTKGMNSVAACRASGIIGY